MGKKLSEMSLEELWQLFPIFLTEHQDGWKEQYKEEKKLLSRILPSGAILRISHIGSTSVGTIWAKPIVDILVELFKQYDMKRIKEILLCNGYTCMSESEGRISLNKGYTENGFAAKVYHVHLRYAGDHDELYFRDYLMDHANITREYEKLKLSLWKKYEYDRDQYAEAKTEFVVKYTEQAKQEAFRGRICVDRHFGPRPDPQHGFFL